MKIIILLLYGTALLAQKSTLNNRFVIIMAKVSYPKEIHEGYTYFWIIPTDSLGLGSFKPLYIDGYSKTTLDDCKERKRVEIFSTTTFEEWNFSDEERKLQLFLPEFFLNNRKKIFSVEIKGTKKFKKNVDIYAIAITGNLCSCPVSKYVEELTNYKGNIYLPVSDVKLDYSVNFENFDESFLIKSLPMTSVEN